MNDIIEADDYILSHISPEPPHLEALYRRTHLTHLYPRMCSGHLQGRLLSMLVAMIKPRRVLELGTFTGYSALCLAENLPEGGEVHTIEIDDEMEPELLELFGSVDEGKKITLHIGDALTIASTLPGPWDLVYIDANKRDYVAYLDAVLPNTPSGSFIIADNTLWDGKVVEPDAAHDRQTEGILAFNDMIAADDSVEKVILPIRDGMTIIRKK